MENGPCLRHQGRGELGLRRAQPCPTAAARENAGARMMSGYRGRALLLLMTSSGEDARQHHARVRRSPCLYTA